MESIEISERVSIPGRLEKDLSEAALNMQRREVIFLVDTYVSIQKWRVASGLRAGKLETQGVPCAVV